MNFIKTEYSFRKVFYHLEKAIDDSIKLGHKEVCLIDDNTFGYIKFEAYCNKVGIRPIFGLTVMLTDEKIKSRSKYESFNTCEELVLIAQNQKGVSELFQIYTKSTENFYYFPRIYPENLTENVIRIDRDNVAVPIFQYSEPEDKATYECLTSSRGEPTHILYAQTDEELIGQFTKSQILFKNTIPSLIEPCEIKHAGMIKYNGDKDFVEECWDGLAALGLSGKEEYCERLQFEIEMILSKDFQDYFMIVSDMINTARRNMIVGPGRGSSGGSLVCYSLGITNIDPIKFGLIFERFIDINRDDFPDIDSDYPDTKRHLVLEATAKKYKSVGNLGTITRYKPKTVINDFAKEYMIPSYDLTELKDSIIQRSMGDARAKACLADTFDGTEIGKEFIEKYPYMKTTTSAEDHARHSGKHAAGIIVLDEDINNYAAYDHQKGIICMEGKDAESIGLLKIDCLGLRTLSVIENCLRLSNVKINTIYNIDLEDKEVLDAFNTSEVSDIFQFDGDAIRMINGAIKVTKFSDLTAITALGRPGALNSGGTAKYMKINSGEEEPTYYGDIYKKITESTNGIVVYQEQTMMLLRQYGSLSWGDVNTMRKIISKSRGDEFFARYKQKFIDGATNNGHSEYDAETVWDAIASMGSYAFNKSHAVAYAMISYWCAYCKVKYPLNFLAANLNNAKDSAHGLKMLRQYLKSHNIEYVPVDPDRSMIGWTIQEGKLIGGLTNILGIGDKKAAEIIKKRLSGVSLTPAVIKKLMNPVTDYDILYPITTEYKDWYDNYNINKISECNKDGKYTIIGKITRIDLRDRNDTQSILKRGGTIIKENTKFLILILEDDTETIKCNIPPYKMEELEGYKLSEILTINDVVVITGDRRKNWNNISIENIKPITKGKYNGNF